MESEVEGSLPEESLSWACQAACRILPCSLSRACVALAIISSTITYPFLAHRERWTGEYMPAGWLKMTSAGQLKWQALYIVFDTFNDLNIWNSPFDPFDTWPLYLSVFNFLASRPAVLFSEDNSLEPSHFYQAGHWVCLSLPVLLTRALEGLLGCDVSRAFALSALAVFFVREWLMAFVTRYTHAFMTRTMRNPRWFWPTHGTEDFDSDGFLLFELALALVQQGLLFAAFIFGAYKL